ncbi:MAG: hypothetical protein HYZ65_03340 [Burkholderiales bacterium]|nr:hypothetical protein [Burkholderiales bacterium]
MKSKILSLMLLCATAATQAAVVDIVWSDDTRFLHSADIPAGKILEVCGRLPAGISVAWSFTSSAPVESNVHYHEGKQVTYPARHAAAVALQDKLELKLEQEYCWMWSNKTQQTVQVGVQLEKVKN